MLRLAFTFVALGAGCDGEPASPAQDTPVEIASTAAAPTAKPIRRFIDDPDVHLAPSPFADVPHVVPTPLALQVRAANKTVAGKDAFRRDDETRRLPPATAAATTPLEMRALMARQAAFLVRERRLASENPTLSPEELGARRATLKAQMIGGAP
jgi:hypothetical protein